MKIDFLSFALTALAISLGLSGSVWAANEARCAALGANCIASEPLNTNVYTSASGQSYWNPSDTTASDKQANNDGIVGAAVSEGSGFNETPINSGEAIAALPAGHTNTWVLRQPIGGGGQAISAQFATTSPTALRSFRFYRYYSPDHIWTDEAHPLCNSGKLLQIANNGTFTGGPLASLNGSVSFYDVNQSFGWSQNIQPNCCMTAPGSQGVTIPSQAQLRGKWWRIEFAMHNAAPGGPATYWEMWLKNVTDNQPEIKVMDSRVAMTLGPDSSFWWQSPMTDNLHVASGQMRDFAINLFRSNNGSTCDGYIAHTSVLWAAWSTDAGQRIGAACEIEGGCSIPPPTDTSVPTVPAGLTAQAASSSQINLGWTASTDNVGVTGYKIFRAGLQIATSAVTSYSNTGLTASSAYSYTVAAYDAAGNTSGQSAAASATTIAAAPTCDVNADGATNVVDVQLVVNQALGLSPCTSDVKQDGVCNVLDVQRIANSALGGACLVGP